jgi:hypothetical protein
MLQKYNCNALPFNKKNRHKVRKCDEKHDILLGEGIEHDHASVL